MRDAWLRPADKRPDGKRDILGNFHNLKDGDEVVSYWPFESNSDESDMYFDGQIMSLASCPGEGTLTGKAKFSYSNMKMHIWSVLLNPKTILP